MCINFSVEGLKRSDYSLYISAACLPLSLSVCPRKTIRESKEGFRLNIIFWSVSALYLVIPVQVTLNLTNGHFKEVSEVILNWTC
jgi:hypothetical protein